MLLDPTRSNFRRSTLLMAGILLAAGLLMAACNRPLPPETPSPLEGKEAPAIELTRLDGTDFRLDDYKGEVVLLDFWATWCGPCVIELPILAEVYDEYKDKGVRFFAVNAAEDRDTIQAFLTARKFDFPVVLDPQRMAASHYNVSSIPMLVVVDQQGVIRHVHTGYREDIGEVLRNELDALLAKPQAAPAEKPAAEPAAESVSRL